MRDDFHWCYEDTIAVVSVLMSLGVIGGLVWLIFKG